MPKSIPASTVHRHFAEVVQRTYSGKEHFIVEKGGLPVVAIISMADYQELMQEREQREQDRKERLRRFEANARAIGEEVAKSGLTEEELLTQLKKDRQAVYEEHYGKNPDR